MSMSVKETEEFYGRLLIETQLLMAYLLFAAILVFTLLGVMLGYGKAQREYTEQERQERISEYLSYGTGPYSFGHPYVR